MVWNIFHFSFFHILGKIIPTDFHIFQRGRSTTNHIYIYNMGCHPSHWLTHIFQDGWNHQHIDSILASCVSSSSGERTWQLPWNSSGRSDRSGGRHQGRLTESLMVFWARSNLRPMTFGMEKTTKCLVFLSVFSSCVADQILWCTYYIIFYYCILYVTN